MSRHRLAAAALIALTMVTAPALRAEERYPVSGLVVAVDAAQRTFTASIDAIPGIMEAMTMSFDVREASELAGIKPGAMVTFTLVAEDGRSHAEQVRVRRDLALHQDPLAARRLALLQQALRGTPARALPVGAEVPDFTLTDQAGRRFALSALRGQIVAVNFIYTTCRLTDFCLRMAHHFAVLQQRFAYILGRDLSLLTITFDPARDTPAVLAQYARQWQPDPDQWRFLTGPVAEVTPVLDRFGVSAFGNEGLMDHSLKTVLIDRRGRVAAVVEGNTYTSDQLADLVATLFRDAR